MQIIKYMAEDIEKTMDMAECNIKKAIECKNSFPLAAKACYNKSIALLETIKGMHDSITEIIKEYRATTGEPPAPMLAVYNYLHARNMDQAALIRNLQELYVKN